MIVRKANNKDISKIVDIHMNRFENFFLTSLGAYFLKTFYKAFLKKPAILLVLIDKNDIVGFAAGSYNNRGFFKKLLFNNFFEFFIAGINIFFTNFKALKRIVFNADKSEKNNLIFAELLSLATLQNNKGYGRYLLESFENEIFKISPTLPISLTTDFENNDKTIQFYQNADYQILEVFESFANRKMIRFIKTNN